MVEACAGIGAAAYSMQLARIMSRLLIQCCFPFHAAFHIQLYSLFVNDPFDFWGMVSHVVVSHAKVYCLYVSKLP